MASKKTQKIYEAIMHLVPTLSEEEAEKAHESLKNVVTEGGEEIAADKPERMDLAYPIRRRLRKEDGSYPRYTEAYLCSVKARSSPERAEAARETLQGDGRVLRFLLVETVAEDTRIGEELPGAKEEEEKRGRGRGSGTKKESGGKAGTAPESGGESGKDAGKGATLKK